MRFSRRAAVSVCATTLLVSFARQTANAFVHVQSPALVQTRNSSMNDRRRRYFSKSTPLSLSTEMPTAQEDCGCESPSSISYSGRPSIEAKGITNLNEISSLPLYNVDGTQTTLKSILSSSSSSSSEEEGNAATGLSMVVFLRSLG
jgi:hypothetical protein